MATLLAYDPETNVLEGLDEAGAPAAVVVAALHEPCVQAFALISAFARSDIDIAASRAPAASQAPRVTSLQSFGFRV